MKLFSYLNQAGMPSVGVVRNEAASEFSDVRDLVPDAPTDMRLLLAQTEFMQSLSERAFSGGPAKRQSMENVQFLPVVPQPGKIVCMGLNYAAHAAEGGNAFPAYPAIFLRAASSQVGAGQPLVRPRVSVQFDYEAELAVVIGHEARHLSESNALACVAGYSIYNDASLRDYQRKSSQWTMGKNFDSTGAFGPWLVTPDELPEGAMGLRIRSILNGSTLQDGNTSDFIWSVAQTLAILSECMTLQPGDVVITGTPAGVGYARKPPIFMQAGDACEVVIDGIGTLRNPIVDENPLQEEPA